MSVETESDLSITLPDGASFRFAKTSTYQRIKGRSLKEMDFGYKDPLWGGMVLVELTSYAKSPVAPTSDLLLLEMAAKARDSLLMLQAAWRGHGEGVALANELPEPCRGQHPLRLCFVVKLRLEHRESFAMSGLQNDLRGRIQVCADLLGLHVQVAVLDHLKAQKKLPITEALPLEPSG